MHPEELPEYVALSVGKHTRKVRTAEGSKYYGLPIGAPITDDIIEAAKIKAKTPAAPAAPTGKPAVPTPSNPNGTTKKPLQGTSTFSIGSKQFTAPADSKIYKEGYFRYVVEADGKVHMYSPAGELTLKDSVQAYYEDLFANTDDEALAADGISIDIFEGQQGTSAINESISDLAVGTVLRSEDGGSSFTKKADNSWKSKTTGFLVEDGDLQPMVDAGTLKVSTTEGATKKSNNEMSKKEFDGYLAGIDDGYSLPLGDKEVVKSGKKWVMDGDESKTVSSVELYALREQLGDPKKATVVEEPKEEKKPEAKSDPEPKKSEPAKEAPKVSVPLPPKAEEKPKVNVTVESYKKGDFVPNVKWLEDAATGTEILHDGKYVYVKSDQGLWGEPKSTYQYPSSVLDAALYYNKVKIQKIGSSKEETKPVKVGDKVPSVEWLANADINTQVQTVLNSYTKTDDNVWVSSKSGTVFSSNDFAGSLEFGSLSIKSFPSIMPDKDESDKTFSFQEMVNFPNGTEVYDPRAEFSFVKQNGDWFYTDDLSVAYSAKEVYTKKLELVSVPGSKPAAPEEAEKNYVLFPDGTAFSKSDIDKVLFGITSGKTFAGSIGDADLEDEQYTDLIKWKNKWKLANIDKPLGAIVEDAEAFLKGLLDPNFKKNEESTSVPIQLGGTKTGKQVTAGDITAAIDALEKSPLLQVKNILAKVNSPLADLNHHDLIGFDKDKSAQKKKYIEFLKQKVAKYSPSAFEAPIAVTAKMENLDLEQGPEPLAPWEIELLTINYDVKEDFEAVSDLATAQNPSGLKPGKYSYNNGKAYMLVHADGTGAYISPKGANKKLTQKAVQANYDAGMSTYLGLPDNADDLSTGNTPNLEENSSSASSPTGKKQAKLAPVKKPADVTSIPEGIYYLGPSTNPSTPVYVVKGGKVKIYPDTDTSGDVEELPLAKIKTNFLKGKILDESGTSILPAGYTGSAYLYNNPVTVGSLLSVKKKLEVELGKDYPDYNLKTGNSVPNIFALSGLAVSLSSVYPKWAQKYKDSSEDSDSIWGYKQHNGFTEKQAKLEVIAEIEKLTVGLSQDAPLADASQYFEFDELGQAVYPAELAKFNYEGYDKAKNTEFIKAASKAIGGGKAIGQAIGTLDQYDRKAWVASFREGNFAAIYELERTYATQNGKSLPNGFLHPGFFDNEATNQISWGPAVAGEISAAKDVPGDWSSLSVTPSQEEISNYLIKAQMQYPEYLNSTERRYWVKYHRNNNKSAVDELSVKAKTRHDDGDSPLSDPLVWTDDLVPAKEYAPVFEEHKFPVAEWDSYSYSAAVAWGLENMDIMKVQSEKAGYTNFDQVVQKYGNAIGNYYGDYTIKDWVQAHFTVLRDEYEAELAKPKYTITSRLPISSAHPVFNMEDQHGNKYIFKPIENGKKQRTAIEHYANVLGRMWGFPSPKTEIVTSLDPDGYLAKAANSMGIQLSEEGLIQQFIPNKGNFKGDDGSNIPFSTLNAKQLGQVAAEHVLDWILDNDDTHRGNLLLGENGNIVGIDKGRGFYVYGNWNGLAANAKANTNASIAYNEMYDDIRSNKISKEDADIAFLAALKAANRIKKSNNDNATEIIRKGLEGRTNWSPPGYMTHFSHEQAPKNADELIEAFLARKDNLPDEVSAMWKKIYADAGYGDLPELTAPKLEVGHAGWSSPTIVEQAVASKAFGTAALHGSAGIEAGSSLIWTEKVSDSVTRLKGQLKLGNFTQKKMLNFLQGQTIQNDASESTGTNIDDFPYTNDWYSAIVGGAKTISHHSEDKQYNEDKINQYGKAKYEIELDEDFWRLDLAADINNQKITFPSGKIVPKSALPQYKLALDHYGALIAKADKAKEDGTKTNPSEFNSYSPIAFKPKTDSYVNSDSGERYTELLNGQVLKQGPDGIEIVSTVPDEAKSGQNGWMTYVKGHSEYVASTKYSLTSAKGDLGERLQDGTLVLSGESKANDMHGYREYKIELPTGETIYFRNQNATQTARAQQGLVTFAFDGEPSAYEGALANVETFLNGAGIDISYGDAEITPELVYWRNTFATVLQSNDKGISEKLKVVKAKLKNMYYEIPAENGVIKNQINEHTFVEAISLTKTPEQELDFWRTLASEAWSEGEVETWIEEGKHLPQFDHMNLTNTEQPTGQPWWNRFGVTAQDIYEKNSLLAIGNNGKDVSLLNYITTGGMLSTEERLRSLGYYKSGASSTSDQQHGSSSNVFTRIASSGKKSELQGSLYGDHVAYWNPLATLKVSAYSFPGDQYGEINNKVEYNPYNPTYAFEKYDSTDNETLVPNTMSLFDYLEIMVFQEESERDKAIQRLKKLGIDILRGLPIEERLIMRNKLKATITKVKEQWKTQS